MTDSTRRALLAALGVGMTTGCLGSLGGDVGSQSETTNSTTTDDPTTSTSTTGTSSPDVTSTSDSWWEEAERTPDPDHSISLVNNDDEQATVRLRVLRDATGETVFEETLTVEADEEVEPYNLKEADPDGVESFTVCATRAASETSTTSSTTSVGSRGNCATVSTDECHAHTLATVQDDGSVQVTYAIC
jgi:hypothetical protein